MPLSCIIAQLVSKGGPRSVQYGIRLRFLLVEYLPTGVVYGAVASGLDLRCQSLALLGQVEDFRLT